MRTTLMVSLLMVSMSLTAVSLLLVRWSGERQVRRGLDADLQHSLATLGNFSHAKNEMQAREAALLADLPSLKALVATGDARTIEDGSQEFADLSGSDFFALTGTDGVLYTYANRDARLEERSVDAGLHACLGRAPSDCLLFSNGRLFVLATQGIYFGPTVKRSQLGYVTIGYAVDTQMAREVSEAAAADIVFLAGGALAASTLNQALLPELLEANRSRRIGGTPHGLKLGMENYVATAAALGQAGDAEVMVVALKSYDVASAYLQRLHRWIEALGVLALMLGSSLAVLTARTITRPLEQLVDGTRALGRGDFELRVGTGGAAEVQELRAAFEAMRHQLKVKQTALMESERLATIGRMAASVSHDLRHHLSAIFANAEFMSLPKTGEGERVELLAEVQDAVQEMTDLIESLLLFGRTGQSLYRSFESTATLVERTAAALRQHPEAREVKLLLVRESNGNAWIDSRSLGRAVYNLILNACQAAKHGRAPAAVQVTVRDLPDAVVISVEDNGAGVAEAIRETLFQPFVSAAKENGTGLGLTLAHHIALEHGGEVRLQESRAGCTRFDLVLYRSAWKDVVPPSSSSNVDDSLSSEGIGSVFAAKPELL